jgi:hypothetical protein
LDWVAGLAARGQILILLANLPDRRPRELRFAGATSNIHLHAPSELLILRIKPISCCGSAVQGLSQRWTDSAFQKDRQFGFEGVENKNFSAVHKTLYNQVAGV